MAETVSPAKMARRRYEKTHKEERKEATGQFNTRLPRPIFEQINRFLKQHGIPKTELIYAGYDTLLRREEEKEKQNGIQEDSPSSACGR